MALHKYKMREKKAYCSVYPKLQSKGAQITLFVILGIVIVVAGVLIYLFFPQIKSTIGFGSENPNVFMAQCLEGEIDNVVPKITSQGGSLNPEHYYLSQGEKIEYLCFTNDFYVGCVMQRPLLKAHIEGEIKSAVSEKAQECLNDLKDNFDSKGYEVNLEGDKYFVEILPEKLRVVFNSSLRLSKTDVKTYDLIEVVLDNNLYELTSVAMSILNWEARYGDAETTTYMNYYKNIKVEKEKQSEGTTIYRVSNRNTGEKIQFASRSVVFPIK